MDESCTKALTQVRGALHADLVELADTRASGARARKGVPVQVRGSALFDALLTLCGVALTLLRPNSAYARLWAAHRPLRLLVRP